MKKLLFGTIMFLGACSEPQSQNNLAKIPNIGEEHMINNVQQIGIAGGNFLYIVVIDSGEYIITGGGGICPLVKHK